MRLLGLIQLSSIRQRIRTGIIWRLLWLISTAIAYTLRFRVIGQDRFEKMLNSGGGIIATWHGITLPLIFYCRHKGLWAIISLSRDGELQNRIIQSRGFRTIRGSSGRQGIKAFLEAARRIKEGGVVALTPDGPRGPARIAQPGIVLMAEKGECDILPVGVACEAAWRLHSWDRHMIPKPFSRTVIVFGEPVKVGQCTTEEDRQKWADEVTKSLDKTITDAETALRGKDKCDACAV